MSITGVPSTLMNDDSFIHDKSSIIIVKLKNLNLKDYKNDFIDSMIPIEFYTV